MISTSIAVHRQLSYALDPSFIIVRTPLRHVFNQENRSPPPHLLPATFMPTSPRLRDSVGQNSVPRYLSIYFVRIQFMKVRQTILKIFIGTGSCPNTASFAFLKLKDHLHSSCLNAQISCSSGGSYYASLNERLKAFFACLVRLY